MCCQYHRERTDFMRLQISAVTTTSQDQSKQSRSRHCNCMFPTTNNDFFYWLRKITFLKKKKLYSHFVEGKSAHSRYVYPLAFLAAHPYRTNYLSSAEAIFIHTHCTTLYMCHTASVLLAIPSVCYDLAYLHLAQTLRIFDVQPRWPQYVAQQETFRNTAGDPRQSIDVTFRQHCK